MTELSMTAPIVVCMKWVALRPDIDPVTGVIEADERWSGPSLADQAALETGLRLAASWDTTCVVVSVGQPAADAMLREALAAGADRVVRIDVATDIDRQPTSANVASLLAAVTEPMQPLLVVCGDWSLDRGSASVPVFLSAELGLDAACGLVALTDSGRSRLEVERRLDGGRREVLTVSGPAVLSVEGAVARLRRAPLAGVLAAARATIEVVSPGVVEWEAAPIKSGLFRPRARILDAPASADPRRRVEVLTGALTNRRPPQRLTLDPDDAADAIIDALRSWGQIP